MSNVNSSQLQLIVEKKSFNFSVPVVIAEEGSAIFLKIPRISMCLVVANTPPELERPEVALLC